MKFFIAFVALYLPLQCLLAQPKYPEVYYQIPQQIRAEATHVSMGQYFSKKGYSQQLAKEMRCWELVAGFDLAQCLSSSTVASNLQFFKHSSLNINQDKKYLCNPVQYKVHRFLLDFSQALPTETLANDGRLLAGSFELIALVEIKKE